MEEEQQLPTFNKDSVKALLAALESNRRVPTGSRNFEMQPNQPINEGNPYPEQPLAGRFMEEQEDI